MDTNGIAIKDTSMRVAKLADSRIRVEDRYPDLHVRTANLSGAVSGCYSHCTGCPAQMGWLTDRHMDDRCRAFKELLNLYFGNDSPIDRDKSTCWELVQHSGHSLVAGT